MFIVLAFASTACGEPLAVPDSRSTASSSDGIAIEAVVSGNPTAASSLLADLPLFLPSSPAMPLSLDSSTATPVAVATSTPAPAASATPAASTTPVVTTTPAATPTSTPATPLPGTTATVTSTPATALARAATPPVTVTAVTVQAATAGAGSDMGSQTVTALNAYRTQQGLPALRINSALTTVANNYAKLMADRNYFAHEGPDGSSPSGRLSGSGYTGRFKGEALAAGQSSPQSALTTWLNSASHRDIVLDRTAVDVGIGYYSKPGTTYTTYWVLITGA